MLIKATIKLAGWETSVGGSILAEVLAYNSDTKNATSQIYAIIDGEKNFMRNSYGLRNVTCYKFLECLGHDNKAGRLLNVQVYT